MFKNVDDKDLDAMCGIAGLDNVSEPEDVPTSVLIPSFIISEMRTAFFIGFLIYVPFLANMFGFEHISLVEYGIAMLLAVSVIPIVEIVKAFQRIGAKKK